MRIILEERAKQAARRIALGTPTPAGLPAEADVDRLRRFMCAYWLRPENALWMALRSRALSGCAFTEPAADVCCGDGIFSFLHHGGKFDPSFDVFWAVRGFEETVQGADMFDHVSETYRPPIELGPQTQLDLGLDLKESLLAKADRLGLYRRLVVHNANEALPLPAACLNTVYCNSAYWVTRIDAFLSELRRVCAPQGRVILHVKLACIRQFGLSARRGGPSDRLFELLVGKRLESWPTLADRRTWESRFAQAGFRVETAVPFVTGSHARIWEIGLRPLAPLLVRMANALAPETRKAIKADWVSIVMELAEPLCDIKLALTGGDQEPVEMQYELVPN